MTIYDSFSLCHFTDIFFAMHVDAKELTIYLLLIVFGRPRFLLPTTSKSNPLLNTSLLSLLKTCPYRRILFALAGLSKVSSKPSKSISSLLRHFSIFLHTLLLSLLVQFFSKSKSHSPAGTMSRSRAASPILRNSNKFVLLFSTKAFFH